VLLTTATINSIINKTNVNSNCVKSVGNDDMFQDDDTPKLTKFSITMSSDLKCKMKSIAPLYGHTLTTITIKLFKDYIALHESKVELDRKMKK